MVRLVALLQPAQDRDRVLDRRLVDVDRREAALERGVLLDVLAVLVERRRADAAELAAGEHRLEQVRGVDRALGGAGADDRVELVDEEDDAALARLDLGEHGLQPLLELAAVLRAGEQRADVERPDLAVLQPLGDVARDDALREPLGDRGLADAGLADQHRVVLRAAREDLDHAADLLVAADDRVELAGLGLLGQVAAELLERLVAALGILRGDALAAAHLLDPREDLLARHGLEREEQVLGRDVVVLELASAPRSARSSTCCSEFEIRGCTFAGAGRRRARGELLLGVRAAAPASRRRAPGRAARAAGARGRSRGSRAGAQAPAPPRRPPGP